MCNSINTGQWYEPWGELVVFLKLVYDKDFKDWDFGWPYLPVGSRSGAFGEYITLRAANTERRAHCWFLFLKRNEEILASHLI